MQRSWDCAGCFELEWRQMARPKPSARDEADGFSDETSESAPKTPKLPLPKSQRKKGVGHRFSPMNAAYGDSAVPPFPKPD